MKIFTWFYLFLLPSEQEGNKKQKQKNKGQIFRIKLQWPWLKASQIVKTLGFG